MSEREWRFYQDDMLSFAVNVVTYCEKLELETFEKTALNYDAMSNYRCLWVKELTKK